MSPQSIPNQNPNTHPTNRGSGRLAWILLLAAAISMGYFVAFDRVDHKLTSEIANRLQAQFPNHHVSIDRARLIPGESILIDGLCIAKATEQGMRSVLKIGRITCQGPVDLLGIIQGQVPIDTIIVDACEASLWPTVDDRWSLQDLVPKQPSSQLHIPTVHIRSGLLRIAHPTGVQAREILCHDLNGVFTQQTPPYPSLSNNTKQQPQQQVFTASLASGHFSRLSIQATRNPLSNSVDLACDLEQLEISKTLLEQLPLPIRTRLSLLQGFTGRLDGSLRGSIQNQNLQFQAHATLREGRLLHPSVPYPIDQLSAELYADPQGVHLRKGQGMSGRASVTLEADISGLSPTAPSIAALSVRNLELDETLYNALPTTVQEHWRRLNLRGTIDAVATLRFNGQTWDPQITVRAKNAGANPDFFPYPISNLSGDFQYRDGIVQAPELTAFAGQTRLHGALTLQRSQPRWLMDLTIASDTPLPIDENLLSALTPRGLPQSGFHRFVNSLHPTGTVSLRKSRFIRSQNKPEQISRSLELTFSECAIRFDGFRYPITDVHGQATLDNDRLILKDFVGRNDGARIHGEGSATCTVSNVESIDLIFQAHNVALDEDLEQALPPSARNLWQQLQPSGVIDRVAIQIQRSAARAPLDLKVAIAESRSSNNGGRGMSLHPLSFPYTIHDIECSVDYRPGRIDIRSLSGIHDSSRVETNGQIRLHSDGSWDGMLNWLPPSRLLIDQVLISSLPPILKEPMTRLSFRGPVSITGSTHIASLSTEFHSLVRDWNLRLDLEDVSISGELAKGIRGSINTYGESNIAGTSASGTINLDALAIKGVAVTGIEGPFALHENQLYLGRDALLWQLRNQTAPRSEAIAKLNSPQSAEVVAAAFQSRVRNGFVEHRDQSNNSWFSTPYKPTIEYPTMDIHEHDIRARTLSGTLFLSGIEPLDGERAAIRLRLVDSDFHGMLVDLGESNTPVNGRLFMECDLRGSINNLYALEGEGKAWLRGANLYELPVMIRLLNLLAIRPDQGAFDAANLEFSIDGDRVPIHKLELDGDLLSMQGKGEVNFRREINLELATNVGRRGLIGALIRPFTENPNANWMRIEVTGTTSNPQIRPPMPLRDSLDQVLLETP